MTCSLASGNSFIADPLLAHPDIDLTLKSNKGRSTVPSAASFGFEDIVQKLLAREEVDILSALNGPLAQTPLHCAGQGDHETIVKMLLECEKIEVNVRGGYHRTPLWYAAWKGPEATTALLLEHNADVEAADDDV